MMLKIISKIIYYIVLYTIAVPVMIHVIYSKIRVGITKHPDRLRLPFSFKMISDLNQMHFTISTWAGSKIWGDGISAKIFRYIRKLRGEKNGV